MIDSIFEFIYTKLLANKHLKRATNRLILLVLPNLINRFGVSLFLNKKDPVVSGALFFGVYENKEIQLIADVAKSGMKFLDVGANIGLYTTVVSKILGPSGTVYSFEPEPESYACLEKNVCLNGLNNVYLHQCALSDHVGEEKLYASTNNGGDNRLYNPGEDPDNFKCLDISVSTADIMLDVSRVSEVDLIKVDVQGYEYYVFSGMVGLIKRSPNVVIFTEFWPDGIYHAGSDPDLLLKIFANLNLNAYDIRSGKSYSGFDEMSKLCKLYVGRQYTNLILSRNFTALSFVK